MVKKALKLRKQSKDNYNGRRIIPEKEALKNDQNHFYANIVKKDGKHLLLDGRNIYISHRLVNFRRSPA